MSQCEVLTVEGRCPDPGYTMVLDPTERVQAKHPVCRRHWDLVYPRGEIFRFALRYRPPERPRKARHAT